MMFSTMTTAPSTTMPKSSAPSESRLAGMWFRLRQMAANRRENGNGERDDQGAAGIAEEQEEDQGHQDDALGEVVQHRVGGEMEQDAAVEKRNDFHAGWEEAVVESATFAWMASQRFVGVGALAQQDDAFRPRRRCPRFCRPLRWMALPI